MKWVVDKVINFSQEKSWGKGFAHLGFHDYFGKQYVLDYDNHWIGCFGENRELEWTLGSFQRYNSKYHIKAEIQKPVFLAGNRKDELLVSSSGNKRVYKIVPEQRSTSVLIDGEEFGMKDIGNCLYDHNGNIWINEITGCKVWQFSSDGEVIRCIGNSKPGFQKENISFDLAQFNWVYDLKCGPDGNIYVLDSKNYSVRMIDLKSQTVKLVVGTGECGYKGDGDIATKARLGGNPHAEFDGPWSLALDEEGNIYIGDTQNYVVRMVEKRSNIISTIAGKTSIEKGKRNSEMEENPLKLNLPLICSMDYYDNRLYIPEWEGDLVVLRKKL
ncbi:hypothetical protein GOQ27_12065 [Clostridium sp. D2Q-11]|uniref:NHL repeat-containing protein n=1 Tax=Anaeromonas frigoriresistens TaxID=2683708 RepID=A0A942UY98_9FIRM|nr:hypothetical protein [Anaeromonas frigoriresistens]MBS4539201.1 hypothetical protein [Anaeromonas frigoriresistens]